MKSYFYVMLLAMSVIIVGFTKTISDPPITDPILSEPTQIELFMEKIAEMESGGNHRIVNQIGMMGKYQFSYRTVRSLGFDVTREEFLSNKHLQDSVMMAYMKYNDRELNRLIDRYEGKVISGVIMSRAAIIAGAHFAGTGGMRTFLTTNGGTETTDINGTTIRRYIRPFSEFHLPPLTTS
jgi:hypothetical protein